MPIEIKELSIKVNANELNKQTPQATDNRPDKEQKEMLINECLEQVAELFRNKKER